MIIENAAPLYFLILSIRNALMHIFLQGVRFFVFISHQLYDDNGVQYFPRNMHTVFALLCFVVVIYWLIFPYPSGLLHWHCGNLTIAPVPTKQPWWIWINTSCEFIMNDCITTTKQSTTKPCAYFLGYTASRVAFLYVLLVVTTNTSANYRRFCVSEVSSHWLISSCA